MKMMRLVVLLVCFQCDSSFGATTQGTISDISGNWFGTLVFPGASLRLAFKISRAADGVLTCKIDSIDQGANDIPVAQTSFADGTLNMDVKRIAATFKGHLTPAGEIEGTWTQAGRDMPLTLRKVDEIPKLRRPQEPTKPYPYESRDLTYENKRAGVKLAATLTLPRGAGPFPVVVLMTGSGAQDRDETVAGHKPFLVIADYLTRKGIAVLRADDRGVGGSTGNSADSTSADFAEDVLAGVAFLKEQKEIDRAKIGLVGHSEGGNVVSIAAGKSNDLAFLVLMAGCGVTGEEILYAQRERFSVTPEDKADAKIIQEGEFRILKEEPDDAMVEERFKALFKSIHPQLSPKAQRETTEEDFIREAKQLRRRWFRYFLTFDPKDALKKVRCPVLAMNGEKDWQVSATQNLPAIEAALKSGGNTRVTGKVLPGLNHLFQTCTTGAPAEYAQIEETIAPQVLETIGDWILNQTR